MISMVLCAKEKWTPALALAPKFNADPPLGVSLSGAAGRLPLLRAMFATGSEQVARGKRSRCWEAMLYARNARPHSSRQESDMKSAPNGDEAWDRIVLIEVFLPRVEPTNCLQRANTSHIGVALHRMRSKR